MILITNSYSQICENMKWKKTLIIYEEDIKSRNFWDG